MTLRYYVSGPMRGIPEWNFPAFDHAAAWLRANGIEAINPADHDRDAMPGIEETEAYAVGADLPQVKDLLAWDLEQISDPACTGLVLIAGWENSAGAAIELAKAQELGKEVWLLQRVGDGYEWGYKSPSYRPGVWTVVRGKVEGDDIEALEYVQQQDLEPINPADHDCELPTTGGCDAAAHDLGHQFTTKDSGKRIAFESGMVRDTDEGKPRYDLIPLAPLRRLAELYARGAVKYGDRNWQKANSPEELARFKASAFRHFVAWLDGDLSEDHAIGTVWNIFAALWLEEKIDPCPGEACYGEGDTCYLHTDGV